MTGTALILIDLQNDYFRDGKQPLFESEAAVEKASKVLDYFRKNEGPVIHIQHISVRQGSAFFLPDTKGSQFHPSVMPLSYETQIIKHFPNSFRDTTLLTQLRATHISKLVICGMMTHMCVDATVRAARDYDFECTLIADACATKKLRISESVVKAADVHNAFLAALNGFYANVMHAEKFLNMNHSD